MVTPVAFTFSFHAKHSYDTTKTGITVPVELACGARIVRLDPKLDTGASFCIFARAYAEMLGLDVESGTKMVVSTANSTFSVFRALVENDDDGLSIRCHSLFRG
jgi:hypothetical protein